MANLHDPGKTSSVSDLAENLQAHDMIEVPELSSRTRISQYVFSETLERDHTEFFPLKYASTLKRFLLCDVWGDWELNLHREGIIISDDKKRVNLTPETMYFDVQGARRSQGCWLAFWGNSEIAKHASRGRYAQKLSLRAWLMIRHPSLFQKKISTPSKSLRVLTWTLASKPSRFPSSRHRKRPRTNGPTRDELGLLDSQALLYDLLDPGRGSHSGEKWRNGEIVQFRRNKRAIHWLKQCDLTSTLSLFKLVSIRQWDSCPEVANWARKMQVPKDAARNALLWANLRPYL